MSSALVFVILAGYTLNKTVLLSEVPELQPVEREQRRRSPLGRHGERRLIPLVVFWLIKLHFLLFSVDLLSVSFPLCSLAAYYSGS